MLLQNDLKRVKPDQTINKTELVCLFCVSVDTALHMHTYQLMHSKEQLCIDSINNFDG